MMKILNKIYLKIADKFLIRLYYPLYYFFQEIFLKHYEIITASIHPMYHNWGDDMSIKICSFINSSIRYIPKRYTWNVFHKKDILCVGSIITWMTSSDSIIWGSGVVYPDVKLSEKPAKVLAVRGPLTRQYLIAQGVYCPEIYGDPALLFPKFYIPKVVKRYKVGIIPHFRDRNHHLVNQIMANDSALLIDVTNVKPWHKFIDDICCCDYIISSSLHGIIISDAYHVPNLWVEFDQGESKRFAFRDYYQSIKIGIDNPYLVTEKTVLTELIGNCREKVLDIDLNQLLSVCPFLTKINS